jgi:hypothetical protein
MSTEILNEILHRVRQELSPDEQLQLLTELSRVTSARKPPRRLCELEGLGKEIWEGINPDEYVRQERDSWGG